MKKTFAYGAATSQGKWPVQEDGFFVDPAHGLFVLADGFGGRGNGDIAAKTALLLWREQVAKVDLSPREAGPLSPMQAWQRNLIQEANNKLIAWNEKRPPGSRGGCSIVVANVENERQLVVSSCGACAAYLLRGAAWISLLSPQAAPPPNPEQALLPSQALGLGKEVFPESRTLTWEKGDLLFLFSSGLGLVRESLQAELMGQLALRQPGSELGGVASLAASGELGEGGGWNQTAIAVEALL